MGKLERKEIRQLVQEMSNPGRTNQCAKKPKRERQGILTQDRNLEIKQLKPLQRGKTCSEEGNHPGTSGRETGIEKMGGRTEGIFVENKRGETF